MIPKVIHYCWFGRNPLPPLALKCIESWKKFFPDYEIKEWNEDNFDINIIPYTKEAYEAKKYAFVSDYARFWILYQYGGVYFDTDVEVIKDMRPLVVCGNFMGKEIGALMKTKNGNEVACVNPGLGLAASKGNLFLKDALNEYLSRHFFMPNGDLNTKTIVTTTTEMLVERGYKSMCGIEKLNDWTIYPEEYFCPKDYYTGELNITEQSYSIHHYDASWKSKKDKTKKKIIRFLGNRLTNFIVKIKHLL